MKEYKLVKQTDCWTIDTGDEQRKIEFVEDRIIIHDEKYEPLESESASSGSCFSLGYRAKNPVHEVQLRLENTEIDIQRFKEIAEKLNSKIEVLKELHIETIKEIMPDY